MQFSNILEKRNNSTKTPKPIIMDQIQQLPVFSQPYFICPHTPPFFCFLAVVFLEQIPHITSFPPVNTSESKNWAFSSDCCGRIWLLVCAWTGTPKWKKVHRAFPVHHPMETPCSEIWILSWWQQKLLKRNDMLYWHGGYNIEGNCKGERLVCGLKGKHFLKSLILGIESQHNTASVTHY